MSKSIESLVKPSSDSGLCYVSQSEIHGRGVYAFQDIKKETQIIEYTGEKITLEEGDERLKKQKPDCAMIFEINKEDDPRGIGFCVDAMVNGNDARFINHCCDPNCYVDIIDGHIWINALKDIKRGEELTFDYWIDHDVDDIPCRCGAKNCRGYIVAEDAKKTVNKEGLLLSQPVNLKQALKNMASPIIRGMNFMLSHHLDKNIVVKLIGLEDIPSLVSLDELSFDDLFYNAREFEEEIKLPSSFGFVAYDITQRSVLNPKTAKGYVMGHSDSSTILPPPSILKPREDEGSYLVSCAVMPGMRRRGMFAQLFSGFEAMTQCQQMSYVRLHTRTKENPEGNGVYEAFQRLGFEITGMLPNHYDEGDDVYEMIKELQPKTTDVLSS